MEVFVLGRPESSEARADPDIRSSQDTLQLSTSPEAISSLPQASAHPATPPLQSSLLSNPDIPEPLLRGVPMIKISNRKVKQRTFRLEQPGALNPALGELVGDRRGIEGYATICWESRKIGRVAVDQIREIRYGSSARPSTASSATFPSSVITSAANSRWISIVYILPPTSWKTLNMIALNDEMFDLWVSTLYNLVSDIKQVSHSRLDKSPDPALSAEAALQVAEVFMGKSGIIGVLGTKDEIATKCVPRASLLDNLPDRPPPRTHRTFSDLEEQNAEKMVTLPEILAMCRKIGISQRVGQSYPSASPGTVSTLQNPQDNIGLIEMYFRSIDHAGRGFLDFEQFRAIVKMIRSNPDVADVWRKLSSTDVDSGQTGILLSTFTQWLRDNQGSHATDEEVLRMFNEFSSGGSSADSSGALMSLEMFSAFLASPDNSVLHTRHRKVCQDMTRPLPEYFVSSSHNTYLIGNQWKGESTVEGYVRALLAGCRSVEIDCYDGDVEPEVTHGNTLTASVPVRDVCTAIASYAFMASPYPIIISAEVHCGVQQQKVLVDILKEVFGDALVTAPLGVIEEWQEETLPSPEQLKYRIMFKSKRVKDVKQRRGSDVKTLIASSSTESTTESEFERAGQGSSRSRFFDRVTAKVSTLGLDSPSYASARRRSFRKTPVRSSSVDSDHALQPLRADNTLALPEVESKSRMKVSIIPELAALMVYTAGVKYQGFSKLIDYKATEMFSVSEKVAKKLLRSTPADFIKHNRTHLSRVYPQGTRISSSNYLPHHYWAMGCHLVALNWQTYDLAFAINHAMFTRNGRCGWLLKPDGLRMKTKSSFGMREDCILFLNIISGHSLPLPNDVSLDEARLYVEASLHVPELVLDTDRPETLSASSGPSTRSRTRVVAHNTYNPRWEETMRLCCKIPGGLDDLCFLRIEVKHQISVSDDITVAHFCGAIGSLEKGLRYVPLFDKQMSQFLYSTLLIESQIKTASS